MINLLKLIISTISGWQTSSKITTDGALRLFAGNSDPDVNAIDALAKNILGAVDLTTVDAELRKNVIDKLSDKELRNHILNTDWIGRKVYYFLKREDHPLIKIRETIRKLSYSLIAPAPQKIIPLPKDIFGEILKNADSQMALEMTAAVKGSSQRENALLKKLSDREHPLSLLKIRQLLVKYPNLKKEMKSLAISVSEVDMKPYSPYYNPEISLNFLQKSSNLTHLCIILTVGDPKKTSNITKLWVKFPDSDCPPILDFSLIGFMYCERFYYFPSSVENFSLLTPNLITSNRLRPHAISDFKEIALEELLFNAKIKRLFLQNVDDHYNDVLPSEHVRLITRTWKSLSGAQPGVFRIGQRWKNVDWIVEEPMTLEQIENLVRELELSLSPDTTVSLTYITEPGRKEVTREVRKTARGHF